MAKIKIFDLEKSTEQEINDFLDEHSDFQVSEMISGNRILFKYADYEDEIIGNRIQQAKNNIHISKISNMLAKRLADKYLSERKQREYDEQQNIIIATNRAIEVHSIELEELENILKNKSK